MRKLSPILFMALVAFSVYGVEERILDHGVMPVVRPGNVWDLSSPVDAEGDCVYRVYGDSLVSEESDGVRIWYDTGNKGIVRLETLLWRVDPDSVVEGAAWLSLPADKTSGFRGSRVRESLPSDSMVGTFRRTKDIQGILILPDMDSIPAVMTQEILTANDYRRLVTRWFPLHSDGDCRLPLAMSINAGYPEDDSITRTFIIDHEEMENLMVAVTDLDIIEVSRAGNILTLTSPKPLNNDVRIDITDLNGISLLDTVLREGDTSIDIDLSTIPVGFWMLVLSSPDVEPRKIRL